ncbi:MAG TPA: hypothetical protein DCY85_01645 [Firmicutes bacterium]|nr:hypothetical protein [Bacillota bacterium]
MAKRKHFKKSALFIMLVVLSIAGIIIFKCITDSGALQAFGDLRGRSIQNRDLSGCEVLHIQRFDGLTKWPEPAKLPAGFDPAAIMELGKDPGLGIRELHARGVTGKGVGVAIIDGSLRLDHSEYGDRIAFYREPPGYKKQPIYHASMVVGILAGKTAGVAPEATIHYFGGHLDNADNIPPIIREIIAYNKELPDSDKIRVISISMGCALPNWMEAIAEAAENGITVVTTADLLNELRLSGIQCPLGKDRNDPVSYQVCYFKREQGVQYDPGELCVPIDNRTFADYQSADSFIFNPSGGMSEGAPYFAGLVALVCQVNPDLTTAEILKFCQQSATPFGQAFIVNPVELIRLAEVTIPRQTLDSYNNNGGLLP